jgi:hypothetical protein
MLKRKKSASPLLSEKDSNELEGLLDEEINVTLFKKLTDRIYLKNLSIYKLKSLFYRVEDFYFKIKELYRKVELENFMNETIDIEGLKEEYKLKKLNKLYPNFNFDRLKELYDSPPTSLKSPAYKNHMKFDEIVVRKYITAILQMVFNKLDLVVVFAGGEGTGKTTASTQDSYLVYHLLNELKIIEYEYNIKDTMYYNLKGVIDGFNKYSQNPLRIFILDEGNELNRKSWSNPMVQLFVQKLRRERKHLRIIFINLPQLGELSTELTLSRVNFIFQLSMKADIKTKLAVKGSCSFYILPRFSFVYSYINKKDLSKAHIINTIGKILDDKKKYFQLLPAELRIHKFSRNGVWSFNEGEYDRKSKKANEMFSTTGVTLSNQEIGYLAKFMNLKKMGVKPNTTAYFCLAHLKNKKLNKAVISSEGVKDIMKFDDDQTI